MLRVLAILALGFAAACSAQDRAKMEAEKLDKMNLSESERVIAAALVEGYKKETGMPILRSRDYGWAACYAKSVEMPARFARVHALYLKDYTAIDRDYYPWFSRNGVNEQAAYEFFSYVEKGLEACTLGSLVRKRLNG